MNHNTTSHVYSHSLLRTSTFTIIMMNYFFTFLRKSSSSFLFIRRIDATFWSFHNSKSKSWQKNLFWWSTYCDFENFPLNFNTSRKLFEFHNHVFRDQFILNFDIIDDNLFPETSDFETFYAFWRKSHTSIINIQLFLKSYYCQSSIDLRSKQ